MNVDVGRIQPVLSVVYLWTPLGQVGQEENEVLGGQMVHGGQKMAPSIQDDDTNLVRRPLKAVNWGRIVCQGLCLILWSYEWMTSNIYPL